MNFARRTACFGCARGRRMSDISKATGSAFGAVSTTTSRAKVSSSPLPDSAPAGDPDDPLNVELVFSSSGLEGNHHDLHWCLAALSVGRTVRVLDLDIIAVHQKPPAPTVASVLQARKRGVSSATSKMNACDSHSSGCLAVLRISPQCRLEFCSRSSLCNVGTFGVSDPSLPTRGLQATPTAPPQKKSRSASKPFANLFGLQSLGSLLFCEAAVDTNRPNGDHARSSLNDKEAKKRMRRWKNLHETFTKLCSFEAIVVDLVWNSSISGALSESEGHLHNLWQRRIRDDQAGLASASSARQVTLWNLRVSVVSLPGAGCHTAKIYFNAMVTRSPPLGLYRGGRFRFCGFLRNVSWKLNSISFQVWLA